MFLFLDSKMAKQQLGVEICHRTGAWKGHFNIALAIIKVEQPAKQLKNPEKDYYDRPHRLPSHTGSRTAD